MLLEGLHPLPSIEFEFWDSRLMNLKCIHEQVRHLPIRGPRGMRVQQGAGELASGEVVADLLLFLSKLNRPKVNKIVEILEKAKSCYWPALQNVYLNVTEGEW